MIFLALSGIHFYWACGGRMSWGTAIPSKADGTPLINPGIIATLVVAFGLLLFAIITLGNSNLVPFDLNQWYVITGDWIIIIIFGLRAVGDFNMVGFFKRIKGTPFAINDTKYYSPLCLFLSLTTLAIKLR
ncbi:hypothetical protein BH09BAC3_BH09BAC3_26530 [soil metagenome]